MRRSRLFVFLAGCAALAIVILSPPLPSNAQSTGSSFGGGSFGGGGGGGGSGGGSFGGGGGGGGSFGGGGGGHSFGSSHSSSSSSSSSTSDIGRTSRHRSRRHAAPARPRPAREWYVLAFCLVVLGGWFVYDRRRKPRLSALSPPRRTPVVKRGDVYAEPLLALPGGIDVSAITIAIDWRERRSVQDTLERLAESGDTSTPGGLARMLHEVVIAIRRVERSWLYAGALNFSPTSAGRAEATFRSIASEMRSRYREEIVRAADGTVSVVEAPDVVARPEEGPGVVAVTVLVAARGEIPDVAHARNADHLRELMRVLGGVGASRLVALEVIWSPSAEDDRMSTAELEALYPELQKIDERSIAGRVFCAYCSYPYAAELSRCPQCGGPRSADGHDDREPVG